MKTILALCAVLACGVTFGGEPVSVVNHGQPTPAITAAPTAQAAPVVVESAPALIAVQQPSRNPCANGKCKLYTVDQQQNDFHRHRLFGGYVTRKGTRTVVKPVR